MALIGSIGSWDDAGAERARGRYKARCIAGSGNAGSAKVHIEVAGAEAGRRGRHPTQALCWEWKSLRGCDSTRPDARNGLGNKRFILG